MKRHRHDEATDPLISDPPTSLEEIAEEDLNDEDFEDIYDDDTGYESIKENWKTSMAALILLGIGLVFFAVSFTSFYYGDWWYGLPALVTGLLTGTPGIYVSFIIYKIYKNDQDYSWEMLPSYDNLST